MGHLTHCIVCPTGLNMSVLGSFIIAFVNVALVSDLCPTAIYKVKSNYNGFAVLYI